MPHLCREGIKGLGQVEETTYVNIKIHKSTPASH